MDEMLRMDRRALMQHITLLMGASALPAEAFAAKASGKGQRFLVPTQLATLSAVADTMIPPTDTPGAVGAGVPAKLDAMLASWASAETRQKVVGALARIDAAAKAGTGKAFAALSPAERTTFLTGHDKAALKNVPPPPNAPRTNFFQQVSYVEDQGYLKVKELVIALYYNSEVAMTKELIYEHVPGTWQPSIKATDQTRPWASVGPF